MSIPNWRIEELQARCDYSIDKNKNSLAACVPDLLREIARLKSLSIVGECTDCDCDYDYDYTLDTSIKIDKNLLPEHLKYLVDK